MINPQGWSLERSFRSIWKRIKRGSWRIAAMSSTSASRKCWRDAEVVGLSTIPLLLRLWTIMGMKLHSLSFANFNLANVSNGSPLFFITGLIMLNWNWTYMCLMGTSSFEFKRMFGYFFRRFFFWCNSWKHVVWSVVGYEKCSWKKRVLLLICFCRVNVDLGKGQCI